MKINHKITIHYIGKKVPITYETEIYDHGCPGALVFQVSDTENMLVPWNVIFSILIEDVES